ncbi:hypothetical protein DL93DRAFT_2072743 [Clavulina sp. PMI_390]|nr:hypothetical protein DL93DRAFT_2072743 [Clavulina sp. PMI_390]
MYPVHHRQSGAETRRDHTTPDPLTRKNIKLENEVRDVLFRMGALIDIMYLEISILPVSQLRLFR